MTASTPTETLIRAHQDGYDAALQASRQPEIDAAVFTDCMFGVIIKAIESYKPRAKADTSVGVNVGRNVGVNDAVLALLRVELKLSEAACSDLEQGIQTGGDWSWGCRIGTPNGPADSADMFTPA